MRSITRCILCFVFLFGECSLQALKAEERSPQEWLAQFADQWDENTWTSGNGRGRYMRPDDDQGWQARMLALQGLVSAGSAAIPPLLESLTADDTPTRILSAQTLGYLAPHFSADASNSIKDRLLAETDPAVRLYLVDALGMRGDSGLSELLTSLRNEERNGDARKHIGYGLARGANGVEPKIIRTLLDWDPATLNSAQLGQTAPDFELATVSGKKVRLSEFRGHQPVVLVFIYGDT